MAHAIITWNSGNEFPKNVRQACNSFDPHGNPVADWHFRFEEGVSIRFLKWLCWRFLERFWEGSASCLASSPDVPFSFFSHFAFTPPAKGAQNVENCPEAVENLGGWHFSPRKDGAIMVERSPWSNGKVLQRSPDCQGSRRRIGWYVPSLVEVRRTGLHTVH